MPGAIIATDQAVPQAWRWKLEVELSQGRPWHLQTQLSARNQKSRQKRFCLAVLMEQKQTVMHYQPQKTRTFLKIVVATPNLVVQARGTSLAPAQPLAGPPGSCITLALSA